MGISARERIGILAKRGRRAAAYSLIALLLAGAPGSAAAEATDSWTSYDKVQHLTFSFLFTLGGQFALESKFGVAREKALLVSIGGSALIGLSKELYDWKLGTPEYVSYRDMVANGVGIAGATVIIVW